MNIENLISKLNVSSDSVERKQKIATEFIRLMSKLGKQF